MQNFQHKDPLWCICSFAQSTKFIEPTDNLLVGWCIAAVAPTLSALARSNLLRMWLRWRELRLAMFGDPKEICSDRRFSDKAANCSGVSSITWAACSEWGERLVEELCRVLLAELLLGERPPQMQLECTDMLSISPLLLASLGSGSKLKNWLAFESLSNILMIGTSGWGVSMMPALRNSSKASS